MTSVVLNVKQNVVWGSDLRFVVCDITRSFLNQLPKISSHLATTPLEISLSSRPCIRALAVPLAINKVQL